MNNERCMSKAFSCVLDVLWGDLDPYNHVGNITHLRLIEECRARWMESVPSDWQGADQGPVVANINLDYRRPIFWPAQVSVLIEPVRVGRSSLVLGHTIEAVEPANLDQPIYAEGQTTLVWIDKASGQSVPLPQAMRDLAAG